PASADQGRHKEHMCSLALLGLSFAAADVPGMRWLPVVSVQNGAAAQDANRHYRGFRRARWFCQGVGEGELSSNSYIDPQYAIVQKMSGPALHPITALFAVQVALLHLSLRVTLARRPSGLISSTCARTLTGLPSIRRGVALARHTPSGLQPI